MSLDKFSNGFRLGVSIVNKERGLIYSQIHRVNLGEATQLIMTGMLDTQDELIRQKLIELGWTPPSTIPQPTSEAHRAFIADELLIMGEASEGPAVVPEQSECQHDYSKPTTTLIARKTDLSMGDCHLCNGEFPTKYR